MTKKQKQQLKRLSLRVSRQTKQVTRLYVVLKDGTVNFI